MYLNNVLKNYVANVKMTSALLTGTFVRYNIDIQIFDDWTIFTKVRACKVKRRPNK